MGDIRQEGLTPLSMALVQPGRSRSIDKPRLKRIRQDISSTRPLAMTGEIRKLMKQVFGENAMFRSPEQAEALIAVVRKEGPLVVVLPTGGGKSLLFMLPSLLSQAHITVVVIPFVALQHDLVQRCQQQDISCQIWRQNLIIKKGLVVVSVEQAVGNDFLGWARHLLEQQQLDRIIIDECHLALIATGYRKKLISLKKITALSCSLLLLTATLPPSYEEKLYQELLLPHARVIRARTDQINIEYRVVKCEEQLIEMTVVKECLDAVAGFESDTDKGIVYCRTRWQCDKVAEILQCRSYHSQTDNQLQVFTEWQNNKEQSFIVATGALGVGVDIENIRIVIHMGLPYGMVDFAQESGRAGRDGKSAMAVVVVQQNEILPDWNTSEDEVAILEFINTKEC